MAWRSGERFRWHGKSTHGSERMRTAWLCWCGVAVNGRHGESWLAKEPYGLLRPARLGIARTGEAWRVIDRQAP